MGTRQPQLEAMKDDIPEEVVEAFNHWIDKCESHAEVTKKRKEAKQTLFRLMEEHKVAVVRDDSRRRRARITSTKELVMDTIKEKQAEAA